MPCALASVGVAPGVAGAGTRRERGTGGCRSAALPFAGGKRKAGGYIELSFDICGGRMSAEISTAGCLVLFLHQCERLPCSATTSPAGCSIGTAQVLRYSVTEPDTVRMLAGRSPWLCQGTIPPGSITRR